MPKPFPLPPDLVEAAARFARGDVEPVAHRDAATVVLLRPGGAPDQGPLVYLMRRQTSMDFAAGFTVFPGGGVDARDHDEDVAWAGPTRAEWADMLGCDQRKAGALVCAAVRETFEEAGVLLAGPSATEVVADVSGDDWEADRQALEARELSLTEFLHRRGLVLRSDLLGAWAGWLTPVFEPRRYATWFFVAVLPEGQRTRDVSTESDRVMWLPARTAVEQVDSGELGMLPPTWMTCLDIAEYSDPPAVLAQARTRRVEMFTPTAGQQGEEWFLSVPPHYRALLDRHAGSS